MASEIEIPVYRSPHIVNHLELDVKRRDAHDYLRDVAGRPQQPAEKYVSLRGDEGRKRGQLVKRGLLI